ncbi:Uncharacterized protein BP5553_09907 [Venustampulla echinocandica]|uniref:Uncharacterized protein n=1 Tax=Venustampulla echinocandica TaxID=2656787 RepID=A0A370TB32_9HELO|nr:Uncharacterized protein BP5553_09907 [Venustampulla echinocandica]RDL31118.1 Uncharacterized protein BP5553_09907 [Venustampulla echinocandica]
MKAKLDYCYKTYANRYKDWHLPVDRCEREQVVRDLFAMVSDPANIQSPISSMGPSRLPIRPLQPHPSSQSPQPIQQPYAVPPDYFLFPPPLPPHALPPPLPPPPGPPPGPPPPRPRRDDGRDHEMDRMSIMTTDTTATWSTGSAQSTYTYLSDTFSNARRSISTSNSSVSSASRIPPSPIFPQRRPLKPPRHDPRDGYWNDDLRVVPCGRDHSHLRWDTPFPTCQGCGFSQWHALMLQARGIDISTFITAMISLRNVSKVDFVGNHSLHFLMTAGVGIEYFTPQLLNDTSSQNVFGQNPLHVLNPQDLGDELLNLLDWFKGRECPPGLLLTQRDVKGRTPMHCLLQYPLERYLYPKILSIFPYAQHQLRSFDISGRTAIMLMNRTALRVKSKSPADYGLIQAGITETKLFQSNGDDGQCGSRMYGFHDIARGARGTSYMGFYECRICNHTNAHRNSYLDQMVCACNSGRDRNGPDDTGMTPAHAIITQERVNDDRHQTQETPSQTAELIRVLLSPNDPTLREAIHVLDREGNSLVYNLATRGLDETLEYVLELEDPSRRRAMVNFCSRGSKGVEISVLRGVLSKYEEIASLIRVTHVTSDARIRQGLTEKLNRLTKVKHILVRYGAEMNPTLTTRWQIYWP